MEQAGAYLIGLVTVGQLVTLDTSATRAELASSAIASASPRGALLPKVFANLKIVGRLTTFPLDRPHLGHHVLQGKRR